MTLNQVLEFLGTVALATAGVALVEGVISYDRFKPAAITLGPFPRSNHGHAGSLSYQPAPDTG